MTSENNIIKDLFSGEGSRKVMTIYWTFLVVILIYHAAVFWVIMQDDIQSKNDKPTFSIAFEEFSDISTESRTINDGEESEYDFFSTFTCPKCEAYVEVYHKPEK